ncbi:SWI/SNF chromatin-remodeling complex subunit SNF5 [Psilocybe cubensis]|uniref:SNF5-domain-containing protein n=2 Tax=Psilocybe cubensis TaxID=181762 RepID=A0A8H8CI77_PSICU|nr:SWI/SNF chromatin-remodeling complex subunit SNF5 [Psilocybe cubensis]KAH9474828.1 SWI/SNF chromatin-remodeling complex subunit SNF5 [Psilocybe cubensis]
MNPNSFQKPSGFNPNTGPFPNNAPQQPPQAQVNIPALLSAAGITQEYFAGLPQQERQILVQKYIHHLRQQQQQQQQNMDRERLMMNMNPSQNFDRPSSSASSHQMMPPPPPRPPTAQGHGPGIPQQQQQQLQHSRPSTAMAHRSPTIPTSMHDMMGQGGQRPLSRMSQRGDNPNGFKPPQAQQQPQQMFNTPNPQQQQQQQQQPSMHIGQQAPPYSASSTPIPPNPSGSPTIGSPYRGAKRKLTGEMVPPNMGIGPGPIPGSPRIGGGGGGLGLSGMGPTGGMMGPPGLPRSVSNDSLGMGGMNTGAMNPMNMSMNMNGMNMPGNMGMGSVSNASMGGAMNGQRNSPRPQSSMGMASNIGGMGGMNMGGMNVDRPHIPSGPQTPIRQGSLPPQQSTPTPQMGPQAQAMMRQGSLPPTPQGPMGMRPGMGMGMNMGIGGMPSSPHGGAPQPMAPSISTSSMASNSLPQVGGMGIPNGGIQPSASSSSLLPGVAPAINANTPAVPNNTSTSNTTSNLAPLPPLPASTNLNPKTTAVTLVPLLTSTTTIPPLSPTTISQIKSWMETDNEYEERVRQMQRTMLTEAREVFAPGGLSGPNWWERGAVGNGTGNFNKYRERHPPRFDVRYPRPKGATSSSRSNRRGTRREGFKLPRKISPEDANRPERLVPIRIEFDVEHHKMRDTFIWNLNDPIITPEVFAQSLVEDYSLAPSYHAIIVKSIQDQLTDFRAHSLVDDDEDHDGDDDGSDADADANHTAGEKSGSAGLIRGSLGADDAKWWDVWRRRVSALAHDDDDDEAQDSERKEVTGKKRGKKRKATTSQSSVLQNPHLQHLKVEDDDTDADASMLADNEFEGADDIKKVTFGFGDDDDEDKGEEGDEKILGEAAFKPMTVDELQQNLDEKLMHEDMRILIKLDIIVASIKLDDQFEWDLDNPNASPEEFAEVYTQELGLGGEFKTAIAHSIREQVQTYQKSLFLVGHPSDGTAVQDDDIKQSFLPSLTSGARPVSEVQQFTPLLNYLSDGELERTEKERDKDLNKRRKRNTRGRRGIALPDREPIRTYRTPAIGFPELDAATLALAAAANAPMSRRAAAAAASVTIANMVASENGTTYMPQTTPSVVSQPAPSAAAVAKEKKPKGLFKAPTYPSSVLRPRAHVVAPTPSTAADVSSMPPQPTEHEAPVSSSSVAPYSLQDSRANKIITAKRAKELEREAKEKEFVDGQHPNYINGVWHCSNCGCPESIAVGRRKGPLGDKSQCGTCGKFWHRHRRPRPVEYNSDPDFHSGLKQKEIEAAKTPASKKKGAAAALRAQSAAHSATPAADASEPQTPTRSNGDLESSRRSPSPSGHQGANQDDDRAMSPVSTASSASEPPLAQKVKMNGSSHTKGASSSGTPMPAPATPARQPAAESSAPPPVSQSHTSSSTATGAVQASPSRTWPPPWLSGAIKAMQARYPHDRFEVTLRKVNASTTPEWRIKCLDCPGKLYTPGPGETLSNYEVHLKNRQHRQRVNDRLSATAAAADGSAGASNS